MQMEMEKGGKVFFDLFVAMCNHMVSQLPLFFVLVPELGWLMLLFG